MLRDREPRDADLGEDAVAAATMAVFDEAVRLHLRLAATVEQIHGDTELTRACRGVLRDLAEMGPRTVPQLARRRPVSRQTVQAQVNQLVAAGVVELLPNPDHARSRLVGLTRAGAAAVEHMWAEEDRLVRRLPASAGCEELDQAARVLRGLRQVLERIPMDATEEGR